MWKSKFGPALRGLWLGFHDKSIRVQMLLGALAVLIGFLVHLSVWEWLIVILCIGAVISMETMNTAIEKVCDLYSKEPDERIRNIKDLSAASVLISALMALVCAIVIGMHLLEV